MVNFSDDLAQFRDSSVNINFQNDLNEFRSNTPDFNVDSGYQGSMPDVSSGVETGLQMQQEAIQNKLDRESQIEQPIQQDQVQNLPIDLSMPQEAQQSAVMPGGAPVTQPFGKYNPGLEPNKSGRNWGVDFGVKEGTPLAVPPGEWIVDDAYSGSSKRGFVGNTKDNAGYGNSVLVRNTKTGETMRFSHLSGVNVKPGQSLKGGTVIGRSGATGNVTGPHLDLEYKVNGQFQDVTKSPYAQYLFGKGMGGGNPIQVLTSMMKKRI